MPACGRVLGLAGVSLIDLTRTTTLLLEGLHDARDDSAWSEFDRRYRPILLGFLRALGANEVDAADVAQETVVEFLRAYRAGRYDRTRGRLRSWLIAIGRTQLALARRRRAARHDGHPVAAEVLDTLEVDASSSHGSEHMERLWNLERRRVILREAFDRLRAESTSGERTLDAFELMVFHGVPPAAVAEQLGMSATDVYQAKSRVTQRLRVHIDAVEQALDEDGG